MKETQASQEYRHRLSGVLGAILIILGIAGFGWIFFFRDGVAPGIAEWKLPDFTSSSELQVPALQQAGITLIHAYQQPALSQQQAEFLAAQLEPVAASKAQRISAYSMLINIAGLDGPVKRSALNNAPVWIIWYQKIPLLGNDTRVDPTPFPRSSYDLFVFLDASSGKELLVLWT